jgi:hypothetical protein
MNWEEESGIENNICISSLQNLKEIRNKLLFPYLSEVESLTAISIIKEETIDFPPQGKNFPSIDFGSRYQ